MCISCTVGTNVLCILVVAFVNANCEQILMPLAKLYTLDS